MRLSELVTRDAQAAVERASAVQQQLDYHRRLGIDQHTMRMIEEARRYAEMYDMVEQYRHAREAAEMFSRMRELEVRRFMSDAQCALNEMKRLEAFTLPVASYLTGRLAESLALPPPMPPQRNILKELQSKVANLEERLAEVENDPPVKEKPFIGFKTEDVE